MGQTSSYFDYLHFDPNDLPGSSPFLVLHNLSSDTTLSDYAAPDYFRVEVSTEEAF
jgi:hypothetical protein